MRQHAAESRGVADVTVELSRVFEIGENHGEAAHRDLVARAEQLLGKEIPEELQRRHLACGGGLVAPSEMLNDDELAGIEGVVERKFGPGCQMIVGATGCALFFEAKAYSFSTVGHHGESPWAFHHRATHPVPPRWKVQLQDAQIG